MPLCASGILMSALTLGLILADIYHDRINYIAEHAILGGIVSILFFTMCNYGFEIVNWVLLSIIPLYIFLKWIFSKPFSDDDDGECCRCKRRKRTCGCPREEPKIPEPTCKPKLSCPAKGGIKMGDQCGVSRFT